MAESPLIAAYTEDEQQTLPSAALGGIQPTGEAATPTGSGLAPHRARSTATAADALVQQIAQEAAVDNDVTRANRGEPVAIAGVPIGLPQPSRRPRILLGVSGSVATIKLTQLTNLLIEFADVQIISTTSARHFFNETELPQECGPVFTDEVEWRSWTAVGDPVVHIELRRWADLLIIAPLSANTLAKIANGLCDNLLTCVVRAWDSTKPLLVAPAMNTYMWESPFTSQHVGSLERLGFRVIAPVAKKLACGDVGNGGMASVETLVDEVKRACVGQGFGVE
jgi:phosphopantothenoylcysteine decarboxylase